MIIIEMTVPCTNTIVTTMITNNNAGFNNNKHIEMAKIHVQVLLVEHKQNLTETTHLAKLQLTKVFATKTTLATAVMKEHFYEIKQSKTNLNDGETCNHHINCSYRTV